MLARFLSRHPSYYELELLNRSVVKSYLVALDAGVYQRGIGYITEVRDGLSTKGSCRQVPSSDKTNAEASLTPGNLVTEEKTFVPVRASALAEAPERAFVGLPTVPIPLAAVPSQIRAGGSQNSAAFGLSKQLPHSKSSKKGAAPKNLARALESG